MSPRDVSAEVRSPPTIDVLSANPSPWKLLYADVGRHTFASRHSIGFGREGFRRYRSGHAPPQFRRRRTAPARERT
jgi:hypothetical protein